MVRACVFALLASLLIVGSFADFGTNITSQTNNGFDVIVLDQPSWVTHIQLSWGQHEFFVFGERTLRTISSGPNASDFYAQPISDNNGGWSFPLIDLHTTFYNNPVTNSTVRITMGVADNQAYSTDYNVAQGPYTPLFSVTEDPSSNSPLAGPKIQPTRTNIGGNVTVDFTGFLTYGVRVDPRNISNNDIVTYLAGYIVGNGTISFALTKTHYNPSNNINPKNRVYTYNPATEVFSLYSNQFTAYSNIYKPFVHYIPWFGPSNHTFVIVVDPNTMSLYGVDIDAGTINQYSFPDSYAYNDIVSCAYDFINNIIFVGISSSGFAPGFIASFNFKNAPAYTIPQAVITQLPLNYSNPKAISSDGTSLFIGMNGYSEILQMDIGNNTFVGYQRLPEYLHRSWDAIATIHHVYFVTYEQNSKIFRVDKANFCSSPCPYNGYCNNGKCVCSSGYVMKSDKSQCLVQAAQQIIGIKHHYTVAHDGEIVLGVFFALAVVAAAAGWFLWYKGRRGAYQAV